jgi:prophage maintenance system killer protein
MALVTTLIFLEINGLTDHDYDAATLLQAILYLAEGQMDGKLFAQFLRDAVSGVTGKWEDESGPC